MSYLNKFNAFASGTFRGRVMMVARKQALDVVNEDPATEWHQRRLNLAEAVLAARSESDPIILDFMMTVLDNATIGGSLNADGTSSAPDGDFEYVVASNWNALVDKGNY